LRLVPAFLPKKHPLFFYYSLPKADFLSRILFSLLLNLLSARRFYSVKRRIALCLLVAAALAITGCNLYRQPDPGNQPDPPEQQQPMNPELPPQADDANPRANRGDMLEQSLASDISNRAREITGVKDAVAIVLGNMAIIGVELRDGVSSEDVEEQVEEKITANFTEIETAYVTSQEDLMDKIASVSERISGGQPTSQLMDDLFQIWQRIQD
jgi:YhcN/YlaJ family sporulation lipoprotein